jgi:hypothetical protein
MSHLCHPRWPGPNGAPGPTGPAAELLPPDPAEEPPSDEPPPEEPPADLDPEPAEVAELDADVSVEDAVVELDGNEDDEVGVPVATCVAAGATRWCRVRAPR